MAIDNNDFYLVAVALVAIIIDFLSFLCQLFLHLRPSSKENVVDKSIFQQSQEHKDEAAHQIHVYGFDIGDLGKCFSQVGVDGGHGQHSGNTCMENKYYY